jgi:hypothetical protein
MEPTANARVRPYMDARSDDPYRSSAAACEKLASATLDQDAKATYLGLAHQWRELAHHVETLDGGWPDKAGIIAKPIV